MSEYLFSFPVCRNHDLFTVRTYVVVFRRNFRRVVLELASPRIPDIHIDRVAITVQFPQAGYFQIIPSLVVEVHLVKSVGRISAFFTQKNFQLPFKVIKFPDDSLHPFNALFSSSYAK